MGSLLDQIKGLLEYLPTQGVARERLALAADKCADLESQIVRLRDENDRLVSEVARLRQLVPSHDFVEARGALFKRKADGTFDGIAYCPDCERALSTVDGFFPPKCSKCGFNAPFKQAEIAAILAELAA